MNQELLNCDRRATELVRKIVQRLRDVSTRPSFDALSLPMDLAVCHNLKHVDLAVLEAAHISDFMHDIAGIGNLDRETGKLASCFLPRCQTRPMLLPRLHSRSRLSAVYRRCWPAKPSAGK